MTQTETVFFSKTHLAYINSQLQNKTPQEILQWAILTIPNLYQTTAFGLTGLVTVDMISKLFPTEKHPIDLIFIDTLHHFKETHELVQAVKDKYPGVTLHTYKPSGATTESEFAAKYGAELWDTNDMYYDYLVKVEPAQRAYEELGVSAVLTGRRRSQGAARSNLPIVQVEDSGLIKINPLANWSFDDVNTYVKKNSVPYNALLDKGYRSVGDYHSTAPVKEGEDERAGRWKGKQKTECGIHETSRFAQFLAQPAQAQV